MKTKTKALALFLSAVLLVVTTVFATMAYLTSTDEVKNTFTVGKVEITLDEADVDEYGNLLNNEKEVWKEGDTLADRVRGNEYKLIPGHTYVKDPTVTVAAGSEQSYIRMIVTITDLTDVKAVLGVDDATNYFLPQYFVEGWDNTKWVTTNVVKEENDTATYEFRYYTTVSTVNDTTAKTLEALFTHIIVPKTIKNTDIEKLAEMQINVVAHAIQADGFETADEAWAAWGN